MDFARRTKRQATRNRILSATLAALLPAALLAETVTIPFGTTVYCELDQRFTSRKKETSRGDIVKAHVGKDVWVDNQLVISAGTPVYARVSEVKKAKIAGRKGKLELEALNVTAVNGPDIPLDAGCDRSERGKMGLSIALAAVVAWPLIFLKGKQAILEPGTIFDSIVPGAVTVDLPESTTAPPRQRITVEPDLVVHVLYDEMDPETKFRELPLELRIIGGPISEAWISAVNGKRVAGLQIRLESTEEDGVYRGAVDFKPLSKHFSRGMNRLEVEADDFTAEVLLEIEL